MDRSVGVALVRIIDIAGTRQIDGIEHRVVDAAVVASYPSELDENVSIATVADNGTAESIDLRTGEEYLVYLYREVDGVFLLTSADEGVFPVVEGIVHPSRGDTFVPETSASRLGVTVP